MAAKSQKKKNTTAVEKGEVTMTPIKKSRSASVDFVIICKNSKGEKFKYGVEKSVLANTSTFFNDMFDSCSGEQEGELELVDFDSDAIRSFLDVCHGVVETGMWTLDLSSDVIDLGHKYGSDIAMVRGIGQFYRAFIDLAYDEKSPGWKKSRFGKAGLLKFVSIWRRSLQGDLCWTMVDSQSYCFSVTSVAPRWFKQCGLDIKTSSAMDLIDLDNTKYFTADDVCVFYKFFKYYHESWNTHSLKAFLAELKKREEAEPVPT